MNDSLLLLNTITALMTGAAFGVLNAALIRWFLR
jgi:hypothetical protein